MTWYATVLPLAGVVLGSAGTLVGQYLTTRVDARRERRAQATAERAERKEAILGFLSAAQSVELFLDRRDVIGSQEDDDEARDQLHALWLTKKTCELVCSDRTAQAAHDYTLALHALLRAGSPTEGVAGKREHRHAFMEEARRELGVNGDRLRRELPPPTR
ncbi:hypothetical protein [Actinoallomurus rhizosphaericola]|uniref:hypothetical protein n=1 Tax=Actinoallomurus rhizosphaericola TaxID=2952536 RepID=UPI0020924748|nr:hypothetical protein [Actinoallomurus rhizosphaericola]MCO5997491.1 hypothetical protein [Actinoallomurus rhizosphaericola]